VLSDFSACARKNCALALKLSGIAPASGLRRGLLPDGSNHFPARGGGRRERDLKKLCKPSVGSSLLPSVNNALAASRVFGAGRPHGARLWRGWRQACGQSPMHCLERTHPQRRIRENRQAVSKLTAVQVGVQALPVLVTGTMTDSQLNGVEMALLRYGAGMRGYLRHDSSLAQSAAERGSV
jgi:hypothetical protein